MQIEEYIDDNQSGFTVFLTNNGEVSGFNVENTWNTKPYVLDKRQYSVSSIYVMTEDIEEACDVAKAAWKTRYNKY